MVLVMDSFQPFTGNMGIYLRRGDVAVSEHHLYRPQVRSSLDQVRGKGMTKTMGAYFFSYTGRQAVFLDFAPDILPG